MYAYLIKLYSSTLSSLSSAERLSPKLLRTMMQTVSYYSQRKNINELLLTAEKYPSIHPVEYFKY